VYTAVQDFPRIFSVWSERRSLDLLTDVVALKTPDMLQVARQQAKKKISESHAANARVYNLRSRTVQLHVGDTVFTRSFAQSNAAKKFSSKLRLSLSRHR